MIVSALSPVLTGTTILVTAQRRAPEMARALERRGADVTIASAIGMESHIDEETLLAETRALLADPPDVLVVTTGIGFRGWLDTAEAAGLGHELVEALDASRIVARGPKARGALQAAGLVADWVAESETSAELVQLLLTEGVEGLRVAVQHHGAGDDGIETALQAAGATTTSLVIYRWGPPPDPEAVARSTRAAACGQYDALVFTSAPGAAAWLTALAEQDGVDQLLALEATGRLTLGAVGPVTAEPLRTRGFDPLVPDRYRLGALVRELIVCLDETVPAVPVPDGVLRVHATSATLDHRRLPLSPSGFAVLKALACTPGAVVSREQLLAVLPGESTDPHTAEMAVARLRDVVGRGTVRTVVKRGYRLDVETPP